MVFMQHTKLRFFRLSSFLLLVTLLIASCAPTVELTPYPTYDPFAPVGQTYVPPEPIQQGEVAISPRTVGPTPTRAALSVNVPTRDPNVEPKSPTPDFPHQLPPPREVVDQYTVQAGDTLGTIAQGYGITL